MPTFDDATSNIKCNHSPIIMLGYKLWKSRTITGSTKKKTVRHVDRTIQWEYLSRHVERKTNGGGTEISVIKS